MSGNKTFFKKASKGNMSFGEIFSDVMKKHSSKDTDRLFISGTELTTPRESEMLAGWQKPFLFARFFLGSAVIAALLWLVSCIIKDNPMPLYMASALIPFIIPVTLLLLVWELNIPRNISLLGILKMVGVGGLISIGVAVPLWAMWALDTVWAGVIEEPAKLLAIYLIVYKKNYKYSINGLLVGMAVGTGFAVFESVAYVLRAASAMAGAAAVNVSSDAILGTSLLQGAQGALLQALVRAITAVSCSHGIWSALYGYALVKAKGAKKLEPNHLINPQFLTFFAISIGLHALNNAEISFGLPKLILEIGLEYILISILVVIVLFYVLKLAVNQVVNLAAQHNEGRVTMAMARESSAPVAPAAPAAPAAASSILLQCVAGPNAGQSFRLHSGRSVTIGRAAGRNDITLSGCDNVSSTHCRFDISGGTVTVTDLGSTNGTYLDSRRITPHQPVAVAPGVTIYLGNKTCAFRLQRN